MSTIDRQRIFSDRTTTILDELQESGQRKRLQMIEGPMDATVKLRDYGEVVCLCSNNYLGLANHPRVVEAGIEGMRRYGGGTASVRFICGTFDCHEQLERRIADFLGMDASYTFTSCWNANEAVFPTFCEPGDLLISDELNHASIIDGVRLAASINKGLHKGIYPHNDLDALRAKLQAAADNPEVTGQMWVVTDGVFSMEGDIADLPGLREICNEFGAMLVVDDSHGTGVLGATGRGTHEHWGMPSSDIDILTSTLGKALGGAAGGFMAGSRHMVD
ncbi:MAG: aminotransferase class I/II-fold pyridoxal phosphate-dependent enzyme, partial [Phycisphaerales bacterium]|nr:aminotransferase class I/II-fold pyridoxal phosphate-dependent enzyme [Phycisphaerales bacterium]